MTEESRDPGDDLLTIGEVIDLLRDEFPDVSVSKVRFLESQGLMAPGRSDGGYRQFDEHDVERLRFILRQQRDHFLPLKVIKSKLTLWERGEEVGPGESPGRPGLLRPDGEPITRSELLRRSGLDDAQVDALVEHHLLEPVAETEEAGDEPVFPPGSVTIATEARRLFAQGLEARHLRAIRHAAEREADVLAQLTAPLLRMTNTEAREQARNILVGCGEAMVAVHRAILSDELRRLIES